MKQRGKLLIKFWNSLNLANALLFALLLGLSVVAYSIAFDKKVSVPRFVVNELVGVLDNFGIKTKFKSISMGFDLSIEAEDVSLRFKGTPEDFLSAKKINVGLDIVGLFRGKDFVDYVEIIGGAAGSSYEGVSKKPVLKDLNMLLNVGYSNCDLKYLHFYFHNLSVRFSGKVEEGFSVDDLTKVIDIISKYAEKSPTKTVAEEKKINIVDVVKIYDSVLLGCDDAKTYLNMFVNPSINVDFSLLNGGSNFFKVDCFTANADFKDIEIPVVANDLKFVLNYANTSTVGRINAMLSVDAVASQKYPVKLENIFARTGIHIDEKDIALFDACIQMNNSEYDGTKMGGVRLAKKMITTTSYKDDWHWLLFSGKRRLSGVFTFDEKMLQTTFDGDVDVAPIFKRKELADIPEMKDFSFPNGICLSGKATYNFGDDFPKLNACIDVSNSVIMRLNVESLMADVSFKEGVLLCSNIVAKSTEGWGATGRYEQNFINNAYDITVKGNLRPMAIAHFMEPWWTKVMGAFTFANPQQLPDADVRVEGTWGAPENIWCYGYVGGHNALYNGAKFDDFSMYIWVNPSRITLYDIFMKAQERTATCFIEWCYAEDGLTSYNLQRLKLDSKLNSTELIALGGEDAKEVLDVVHLSVAPELKLIAHMVNPDNNPQKKRDIFNAEVFAPKETSIEMIKLNNVSCTVRSDQIDTDVENAHFYFCDGKAEGKLHLTRSGDTMLVSGTAKAEKMNQGAFFKFLDSLGESSTESKTTEKSESPLGGAEDGEVSANITLSGDVKNMINSQGKGSLFIESKDFLKLNVFGGLSKAFNSIGLPIGSFDINTLKTSFEIGGKELKVSPIEMTGPSMRVIGASVYSLENGAVRGEIKAYPFDKVKNRLVSAVNKLVNPLMDTVRIIISGTLDNPEFSAKMTPADVIRSEENVIQRIDKSL